jgi:hypothetical protein
MIYLILIFLILITLYSIVIFLFGERYFYYSKNTWLQRKIINYRSKGGFYKKIHLVVVFFLIGFSISYFLYLSWFNDNPSRQINLENISVTDFVITDSAVVSKSDELIEQIQLAKNKASKENEFFSFETVYYFFSDRGDFVGWIMGFYGFLTIIIGFYEFSKFEKFSLLFQKSKDKIKILNKFSSNNLFNENSIFENIIELLDRTVSEANAKPNSKVHLKMLLCSPLLDRSTNNPDNWGKDFVAKIRSIATTSNIDIKLFHLPNEVISGVNPLQNFTEVLANYAAKNHNINELEAFKKIWKSTSDNISILESLAKQTNNTFTINETKLDDIPFQVIISKSPLLEEVIVFFAGKSNLENETVSDEPRGFHSVDPVVIETFDKIFNDYVSLKQRVPIRPEHTQQIINVLNKNATDTQISNYLASSCSDIFKDYISGLNVTIKPKTFSPAIANSSKFTSRVIQEMIKKDDIFLEIGAGSGVQTIVGYKMLEKLGNNIPLVFAIENSQTAYNCLLENCKSNSIYKDNDGIRTSGVYLYNSQLTLDSEISPFENISKDLSNLKFTFIVADLPFVDTKVKEVDKDLESAFFDEKHKLQESLLKFFSTNDTIVDDKARLLTSFSSLGGDLDILSFEMLINKYNLSTIKKIAFVENGYEWITYIIMRKNSFVNYLTSEPNRYWWEVLNVKS